MNGDADTNKRRNGLILTGGGARAAYQVGVLKGLAEILPKDVKTPFSVITGTSAGAINAVALASHGDNFQRGVRRLVRVWSHMETAKVYRTDWGTVLSNGLRWFRGLVFGGLSAGDPRSLLDNAPLRQTLSKTIRLEGIEEAIKGGSLHGLGITVSGYTSARALTFCQTEKGSFKPWLRTRRQGEYADINVDHLMASAAMPFIFPAVKIDREYYGDGVMRQSAPLSSAIHLGADRLLVVGVRNEDPNELPAAGQKIAYPTVGHIMGYMLDTLFMDNLYTDIERLRRINQVLERLHADAHPDEVHLRHIDCDVVVPSSDIRHLAHKHAKTFPRPVRFLFSGLGALNPEGSQLMSYLLFEPGYMKDLVELGYQDTMARRDALLRYLLET